MAFDWSRLFDGAGILAEFEEAGYPCMVRANALLGHRCGYVAVPRDHPLAGKDAAELALEGPDLGVDGGITWSAGMGGRWVLGWDAGHYWQRPDPGLVDPALAEVADGLGLHEAIFGPARYFVDAQMAEDETRRLARRLAELAGA